MRAEEHFTPADLLMPLLAEVEDAARRMDRGRMRDILQATVKEYSPSEKINDLLWDSSGSLDIAAVKATGKNIH